MKIVDLGQVIATRAFSLNAEDDVIAKLGCPFSSVETGGDYVCPYQIIGVGSGKVRYAVGVDGIQAIHLALMRIGTDLYTSDEAKNKRLTWKGSNDFDLPLASSIKDMLSE